MITSIKGKAQYLHRFILDAKFGDVVDHANADTTDNRRSNIRIATHRENNVNKQVFESTDPFRGVRFCTGPGRKTNPWQARIKYFDNEIHLGRYPTADEAAYVYDQASIQLNGEFAVLNVLYV